MGDANVEKYCAICSASKKNLFSSNVNTKKYQWEMINYYEENDTINSIIRTVDFSSTYDV